MALATRLWSRRVPRSRRERILLTSRAIAILAERILWGGRGALTVGTDRWELTGLVATVPAIGRVTSISICECIPATDRDRGREAQSAHRATCRGERLATAAPRIDPIVPTTVLAVSVVVRREPASIPTSISQSALASGMAHFSSLDCVRAARIRHTRAGKWRTVAFNTAAGRATAAVALREVRATGNRVTGLWIKVGRRVPLGGLWIEEVRGRRVGSRGACELRVGRVLGR